MSPAVRVPLHAVSVRQPRVQRGWVRLKHPLRPLGQPLEGKRELHEPVRVRRQYGLHELSMRGQKVEQQPRVPLVPRGHRLQPAVRAVVEVEDLPEERLVARGEEPAQVVPVLLQHLQHAVYAGGEGSVAALQDPVELLERRRLARTGVAPGGARLLPRSAAVIVSPSRAVHLVGIPGPDDHDIRSIALWNTKACNLGAWSLTSRRLGFTHTRAGASGSLEVRGFFGCSVGCLLLWRFKV